MGFHVMSVQSHEISWHGCQLMLCQHVTRTWHASETDVFDVHISFSLYLVLIYQHFTDASPSEISGFLASLLGPGSECHGYEVNIVGHSLGGAIATLLGLRVSTF